MKAVTIDPPLDPATSRAVLKTLFPAGEEYIVRDPSSRVISVVFFDPPALGDDPAAIVKAVFPAPGRYIVATRAEAKASKEAFSDWFLERLLEEARNHYTSSRALMRRAIEHFIREHEGSLTTPESFAHFESLLFDLRGASGLSIGMPVSTTTRKRLEEIGFSEREIYDWPALAYRFGLVAKSIGPSGTFSWARAMALASAVDLTDTERAAMAYARQRSGLLLTPVLLRDVETAWSLVADEERRLLRIMTRQAIRDRGGAFKLSRDLFTRMDQEGIYRDWERVARTEIANARNGAAWDEESRNWLKDEPLYRDTSIAACNECLSLYKNRDGSPRVYTRAEVLASDELGANRSKPYHAMIGATHPNCACGPWQKAPAGFLAELHRKKFGPVIEERGL